MDRALILSGGGPRGAFQAGVLKYLDEAGWKPDLICGASAGAINAAAIGSGLKPDQLADLWQTSDSQNVFKITLHEFIRSFLSRRKFQFVVDTSPMKSKIIKYINIESLRKSKTEILISAINMRTSELKYFDQRVITIDHIMASAAIPGIFPWQVIDGEPYWDSGLMANVPIMPAIERGAKTIIVVLLSPIGNIIHPVPETHLQVAQLILEHFLIGSYNAIMTNSELKRSHKILLVSPSRMLPLRSLIVFSPKLAGELIREGYQEAQKQLSLSLR